MVNFITYKGDFLYYNTFNPYTFKLDSESIINEIPPLFQYKCKEKPSNIVFLLGNEKQNCILTNYNNYTITKNYTKAIIENITKLFNSISEKESIDSLEFKCIMEDSLVYFSVIKSIIENTSFKKYTIHTTGTNLTPEIKKYIEDKNIKIVFHLRNKDIDFEPNEVYIYHKIIDNQFIDFETYIKKYKNIVDIIPIFDYNNKNITILNNIKKYYVLFENFIKNNDIWLQIKRYKEIYDYIKTIYIDEKFVFNSNENHCFMHNEHNLYIDGSKKLYYCDSVREDFKEGVKYDVYSSIKTRCNNCPVISICKCYCNACYSNEVRRELKCYCDYHKYLVFLKTFFFKEMNMDIKRIEGNYFYSNFIKNLY